MSDRLDQFVSRLNVLWARLATTENAFGAALMAVWTLAAMAGGPLFLVAVALLAGVGLYLINVDSGSHAMTWLTAVFMVLMVLLVVPDIGDEALVPGLAALGGTSVLAEIELIRLAHARRRSGYTVVSMAGGGVAGGGVDGGGVDGGGVDGGGVSRDRWSLRTAVAGAVGVCGAVAWLTVQAAASLAEGGGAGERSWLWMPAAAVALFATGFALTVLPPRGRPSGSDKRWQPGRRVPPQPLVSGDDGGSSGDDSNPGQTRLEV